MCALKYPVVVFIFMRDTIPAIEREIDVVMFIFMTDTFTSMGERLMIGGISCMGVTCSIHFFTV